MALTKKVKGVEYECLLYPMEYVNISQGVRGTFSHAGCSAIDICGKDTGIDTFYAPCSMKCVGYDPDYSAGHPVWFESVNKVLFADGTIDYATMMVLHDNDINDVIKMFGKVYKQGEAVLSEGTAGFCTGNHNHYEIAKGKFTTFYARNSYGTWHLPGCIDPDYALVIDGRKLINNGQPSMGGDLMEWITSDKIKGIDKEKVFTGWKQTSGGGWQYYDKSGKLYYGWLKDKNDWYYIGRSTYALIGWNELEYKGKKEWFYFDVKSCKMATGWKEISKKWYYFDENGRMTRNIWVWYNKDYYYIANDGAMVVGKKTIEGVEYFFKSNGAMDRNYYAPKVYGYGIDVSSHNDKSLDLSKYDFVIIRATWGTNKDESFDYWADKCEKLGIPYGVYCYSYGLAKGDGKAEANYLLEATKGRKIRLGYWCDMEDADSYKQKRNACTKGICTMITKEFCDTIKANGKYTGYYTSMSWIKTMVDVDYPCWMAWWGVDINKYNDCVIHQYQGDPLDLNVVYMPIEKFEK